MDNVIAEKNKKEVVKIFKTSSQKEDKIEYVDEIGEWYKKKKKKIEIIDD